VTNNGCYAICGLELSHTSFKEDQLTSALGYTVHVLLMLSKYLQVWPQLPVNNSLNLLKTGLRFQLIYHASRSMVRDLGSSGGDAVFFLSNKVKY